MAVQPVGGSPTAIPAAAKSTAEEGRFVDELTRMIQDVNRDQIEASQTMERLLVHGEGSIHEAMMAASKAEGSFRLLMTMRNSLIEAVNRLLQTQV